MLKFFEHAESCEIILDPPIIRDDISMLKRLFNKDYTSWSLTFGRIYSVERSIVMLLHSEIFTKNKNIAIVTYKNKLTRYFNRLGFKATFVSLIKDEVVDASNIEIVLIGGSADSSSKIIDIVKEDSFLHLTLVIVQHVEPHKEGMFDKILQQYTKERVSYAKDGEKILKGRIYLSPQDSHLKVRDGRFHFTYEPKYNYSRPSISLSYDSFSNYYKESLLVIQECGYAKDGVDKLSLVHNNNSKIIVQDPKECEANSMVTNAIHQDVQDYIFNKKTIISYINFLDKREGVDAWVIYLLEMIFQIYSYNFKLYQRDMIKRRLEVFMIKHQIKNTKDAVGIILFNRSAFKAFFLEVSINVTEFFRNPTTYSHIKEFISRVHKHSHNIKIWSAGCSSGKEAYSIAILLDTLGMLDKSIIYATDFNSVILEDARSALYSKESYEVALQNFELLGLEESLEKYMIRNDNFMMIAERIVQKVLFLQHNLETDSSFNEFDIIICKNVIIYFNLTLQKKVFKLIYDSLRFGGYLILGESETIEISFTNRFKRCNDNYKIYKKVA